MNDNSTIFALSSGAGVAGIAVIRVSGPGAGSAVDALAGSRPAARKAVLRRLVGITGQAIDEAMVIWLPGPGTATGEDMAEFHVHGSTAVVGAVLAELAGMAGFRPAAAGEFSTRAFVNGRMDLVEVEGLSDLLAARTEEQRRQAMYHMSGAASSAYDSWLKRMTSLLARLEAAIDFVEEEGVAEESLRLARPETEKLIAELETAIASADRADVVRGGMRIALVGAPNVGKSSLLNRLADREAAIVSPVPGTTRDAIEVSLVMGGLPVTITDTAGLRLETNDDIERQGMERSVKAAHAAHIVVEVCAPDVRASIGSLLVGPRLKVLNKCDVGDSILDRNGFDFGISAKTGFGIDRLLAGLERLIAESYHSIESPVVVRERHKASLRNSIRHLNESLAVDDSRIELSVEHIRSAAHELARITGKVDVEDVLGQIFSEFCIGK